MQPQQQRSHPGRTDRASATEVSAEARAHPQLRTEVGMMPVPACGAVRGVNATAASAEASSSSRSSTRRSSHSGPGCASDAKRFTYPPRSPGFQHLGGIEMSQVPEIRRPTQRTFVARPVTTAEASCQTTGLLELGTLQQGGHVAVRQVNWQVKRRFKKFLLATAISSAIALFFYAISVMWNHISYPDVFRTASRSAYFDHAHQTRFSGCDTTACQMYMSSLESSLNRSQDPCENFYRFVCDGWQREHRLLTVLDVAVNYMYDHALSATEGPCPEIGKTDYAQWAAAVVPKRLVELARSCIELSESSLDRLKMFLAERHLPWPKTSRRDLFETLLDLSGNWNIHLWFQVSLNLTHSRYFTGGPVLRIGQGAALREWIAFMRPFVGQTRDLTQSIRYQQYVLSMLRIFDAPETQASDLVAIIKAMNRLTLAVLGPAVADTEQRFLSMSISNLTERTTPGMTTGRLLLLLNEHFMWAQPFSSNDIVQVENPDLLRAVFYLFSLHSDTREALTLSLGLRLVHEVGWMADQEIADVTLEVMGLPSSVHPRRCLVTIENSVGVAWLSLFPTSNEFQTLVKDVRDTVADIVKRRSRSVLDVRAQGDDATWSLLASVLPQPANKAGFFTYWIRLMKDRWRLQQHNLTNILKPGTALTNRWNVHGTLTVSREFFAFPLYHPDLPAAVNYGGAGRLIADEILRGVLLNPVYDESSRGPQIPPEHRSSQTTTTESASERSPHQVDASALLAALNGYRLRILQQPSDAPSMETSLAHDRLFFVSSCYALCSSGDYEDEVYGEASRRCNEALMKLSEFTAAVKCEQEYRPH